MRGKKLYLPPRICRYCHNPFMPKRARQQFCPRPSQCCYRLPHNTVKGLAAANVKRRALRIAKQEASLVELFGIVTERERQIYELGHMRGYAVGYGKAYAPLRKRSAA